ncbi:MAG: hypothetical protein HYZ25_00580 [Chloroflexi bacterium]|nr:hypothetical protein [Chloroflexota bacterium]
MTFLAIVISSLLISCASQKTTIYPTATLTGIQPIELTQLTKPISTPNISNIPREAHDFLPNPTATPDLERRKAEEIAIYSAFLKETCTTQDKSSITFLVLEETVYEEGYYKDTDLLQEEPSLSVQTLQDYRRNNKAQRLPPEILPENGPCKFISPDEVAAQKENWDYKNWLIYFSSIGFNEKYNQAILFSGYYCGKLCAGEELYILLRNNGKWDVKRWFPLWIS